MPTFFSKEYGTNYDVELENILSAHCTPHYLNKITSITSL